MPNTWAKIKLAKLQAWQLTRAKGDYARYSENAEGVHDRRNGFAVRETTSDKASNRALIGPHYATIKRCEAGKAHGLNEDVGHMGKNKRTRVTRCYGDGRRQRVGSADVSAAALVWAASRRA